MLNRTVAWSSIAVTIPALNISIASSARTYDSDAKNRTLLSEGTLSVANSIRLGSRLVAVDLWTGPLTAGEWQGKPEHVFAPHRRLRAWAQCFADAFRPSRHQLALLPQNLVLRILGFGRRAGLRALAIGLNIANNSLSARLNVYVADGHALWSLTSAAL